MINFYLHLFCQFCLLYIVFFMKERERERERKREKEREYYISLSKKIKELPKMQI